ncbi:Imm26 family immunity protein [Stenotrophomonas sp.]|uniref:Imm26 family immunity protein n=1 Tax=Stenotrophomonas sp. TaxID=69392 RepID=UPI0028A83C19|nr:Imm26 family immunity protein [Stenotrophomonas sp.]
MIQKKPRRRIRINAGDVFAVPLSVDELIFGYVRAYQDPDVAILPFISNGRMLGEHEIPTLECHLHVASLRVAMERGEWPRIGRVPFEDEVSSWPPPRKQIIDFRPDVRLVIVQGRLVNSDLYGEWENLPEIVRRDDDGLKQLIQDAKSGFLQME